MHTMNFNQKQLQSSAEGSFKHYCWNAQIKEPQNVMRQFRTLRWVSVSSKRHVFLFKINVLQHHDGLEMKETNLGKSFDNYTTKLAAAWDLQKLAKRQQTLKTTGRFASKWVDWWMSGRMNGQTRIYRRLWMGRTPTWAYGLHHKQNFCRLMMANTHRGQVGSVYPFLLWTTWLVWGKKVPYVVHR